MYSFFKILKKIESAGCFIRTQFHIYCPGCGGTRATESLFRLKITESLHYNPLIILLLLDFMIIFVLKIIENKNGTTKNYQIRIVLHSLLLIAIGAVFLCRNYMLLYKGIDFLGDFS